MWVKCEVGLNNPHTFSETSKKFRGPTCKNSRENIRGIMALSHTKAYKVNIKTA